MGLKLSYKFDEPNVEEDYPGQMNEYRRQKVVEAAMSAIHHILDEGSDGSVEEADFLYSVLAVKLIESNHGRVQSRMLRHDLEQRHHVNLSVTSRQRTQTAPNETPTD